MIASVYKETISNSILNFEIKFLQVIDFLYNKCFSDINLIAE